MPCTLNIWRPKASSSSSPGFVKEHIIPKPEASLANHWLFNRPADKQGMHENCSYVWRKHVEHDCTKVEC